MDKFIDEINGYYDIETTFWRGDTDSLFVHAKEFEKIKQYIGKDLSNIDFDIQGKIIRFIEICPKVYFSEFIRFKSDEKTGSEYGKHVRAKGFSKDDQKLLTWNDFKNILFGNFSEKQVNTKIKDDFDHVKGSITRIHDQIILKIDNKISGVGKVVNKKQKEKGFEFSSIITQRFERTLNKTKWSKRDYIPNHPNLASLPKL